MGTNSFLPSHIVPPHNNPNSVRVVPSDLRQFVKCKKDIYMILAYEGQYYLPPYDECSMDFVRDALAGKKKLLKNQQVVIVEVPRYKEFNVKGLYELSLQDSDLKQYLPDKKADSEPGK